MKKWIRKTIGTVSAAAMAFGVFAISASAILGDLNDSGKMNSADARLLLQYSAHTVTIDEEKLALADYTCDGRVNSADARMLLRAAAKLENLDSYKNYYVEIDGEGLNGAFGYSNGAIFAETAALGPKMGMVLEADGDFVFIDHDNSRYAILTVSDQEALKRLMEAQGGESIDFKDVLADSTKDMPQLSTPTKLLEDGYEKSDAEWNGAKAQAYSDGALTYYFSGRTLLATVGANGSKVSYRNFSETPDEYIYAYKTNGYKNVDFMELMMSMVDMF